MKKSDGCPRDSLSQQGNDRPFQLPEALADNQRILFKRTDYCGGGARPRPGAKAETRGRNDGKDGRTDIRPVAFSNIWTGSRIDTRCRSTDSVDVLTNTDTCYRTETRADNSRLGSWIENLNSHVGCKADTSRADNSCIGSRAGNSPSSRISDYRPKCQTMTAENEMKVQYMFLKEQYGRICEQESVLRNQMALLQAEIILMQTKAYHKSPADVRRITIDPIPIRRVKNKSREVPSVSSMRNMTVKVDPKVTAGRYFTTKATKATMDNKIPDIKKEEVSTAENIPNPSNGNKMVSDDQKSKTASDYMSYETGDVVNRCFYFDIPLAVVAPPYTKMNTEKVTRHRLPKLKLPKITTTKGIKAPTQLVAQLPQCHSGYK